MTKEEVINKLFGISITAKDLTPMDKGECMKCMDFYASIVSAEKDKEIERLKGFVEKCVKSNASEEFFAGSRDTENGVIDFMEESWQQFKTKHNL